MDQKHALKGVVQPQAWHAGDVSASPEQGEACELAGATRARQPSLGARIRKHKNIGTAAPEYIRGDEILPTVTTACAKRTGAAANVQRRQREPARAISPE